MRLLHLCPRYQPSVGGSERYMQILSEGLAARGHDVTVLTTDSLDHDGIFHAELRHHRVPPEFAGGVKIVRCPAPHSGPRCRALDEATARYPSFACERILEYVDRVTPGEFDLVHVACFPFANLLHAADVAAGRARCPMMMTPFAHTHPLLARHFQQSVLRHYAQRADVILCQTDHEADFLAAWDVPRERLMGFGLSAEPRPTTRGRPTRLRSKYGLGNEPIVAHLASNSRLKGTETIVEIAQRFDKGEVMFVIAGNPSEHFQRKWQSLSDSQRGNVRLLGLVDEQDKCDLLEAMAVLAVPSIAESFGIVYLEAWQHRSPVIAADYGPTGELVDHGTDGLLVEFENANQLEAAIRAYLADEPLRLSHGVAGAQKLAAMPTWAERVATLEATCTAAQCHGDDAMRTAGGRVVST